LDLDPLNSLMKYIRSQKEQRLVFLLIAADYCGCAVRADKILNRIGNSLARIDTETVGA